MNKLKELFKVLIICRFLLKVSFVLPEIQPRIVGGTEININQAPFVVQLLYNNEFICGGTLVSTRFVVTAAHCVYGWQRKGFIIAAGSTNINQDGVRARVSKAKVHKRFRYYKYGWDVAVLKLSSNLTGEDIHTISLCTRSWKPQAGVQIYGWGKLSEEDNNAFNELRMATVKVIDNPTCSRLFRKHIVLDKSMFCASILGSKGSCIGDSGGPAVINGEFCGVISGGITCPPSKLPGTYINVLKVRRFIENAMKKM